MNIIILNTNSFGGNYEYSRCLAAAYAEHADVEKCTVVIPENAAQPETEIFKKILISDLPAINVTLFKKIYFLYRSLVNPFRVFRYLKNAPASAVVFNDYEQITALIWVPFIKKLKKKHTFLVILHDPDRDAYLPVKWLSEITMKKVMSIMDVALYHELLPDKVYYKKEIPKINIPHGLYTHSLFDQHLLNHLIHQKGEKKMMGVIGNIRDEKNYSFLIQCLPELPDVILLIAGSPSNSSVSIASYKEEIEKRNVQDRVIWIEKKLTDEEMQGIIQACDLMLLYYKYSFTSQSGLLNLIAPHKKKLIVSDGQSGLTKIVEQYKLGAVVPIDKKSFVQAVNQIVFTDMSAEQQFAWDRYLDYASWHNHTRIVIEQVQKMKKTFSAKI
jgi:glycosyltransferase involved in cell wall biosynthesis